MFSPPNVTKQTIHFLKADISDSRIASSNFPQPAAKEDHKYGALCVHVPSQSAI